MKVSGGGAIWGYREINLFEYRIPWPIRIRNLINSAGISDDKLTTNLVWSLRYRNSKKKKYLWIIIVKNKFFRSLHTYVCIYVLWHKIDKNEYDCDIDICNRYFTNVADCLAPALTGMGKLSQLSEVVAVVAHSSPSSQHVSRLSSTGDSPPASLHIQMDISLHTLGETNFLFFRFCRCEWTVCTTFTLAPRRVFDGVFQKKPGVLLLLHIVKHYS